MYSNILKVFLLSILPIFNIIGESEKKKVLVGKIDNNIDPRTNRYSKLLLEEASENNYDIPNLLILKKVVFKVISSIFASSISLSLLNQIYYARNSFISKIAILIIGFTVFTLIYYVLTKFFKVNKLYLKSKI